MIPDALLGDDRPKKNSKESDDTVNETSGEALAKELPRDELMAEEPQGNIKEAAKEKVSEVKEKAEEAKEAVEEKASEAKEAIEEKAEEVKEAVEGKSDESKDAEEEKEYTKCEWCGFKVEVGTDECPNCHNKIEPKKEAPKDEVKKEEAAEKSADSEDEIPEGKKRCVKCGHLLDVDMTFCEECGEKQPAAGKSGLKSLFGKFKGGKH
jgi:small subunit ribosomal protein S3